MDSSSAPSLLAGASDAIVVFVYLVTFPELSDCLFELSDLILCCCNVGKSSLDDFLRVTTV